MSGRDPEGASAGVLFSVPTGRGRKRGVSFQAHTTSLEAQRGKERGVSLGEERGQGTSAVQQAFIRKSRGSRL
jgi:hypothetical protein